MTNISISDSECWVCGKPFSDEEGMGRTTHHTLPQHLNPVKNILVPIHESCHDKINQVDVAGMTAFAYKIHKSTEDLSKQVAKLTKNVQSAESFKIADILAKSSKKK